MVYAASASSFPIHATNIKAASRRWQLAPLRDYCNPGPKKGKKSKAIDEARADLTDDSQRNVTHL